MKSKKRTRISTARLLAFGVSIALILCALLSFGLFDPRSARAENDPPAKTVNGIRFVQVAAGEDFAIGLTFDGDLYGWSLLTPGSYTPGNIQYEGEWTSSSLGHYYTTEPKKINVVFRKSNYMNSGRDWAADEEYHAPLVDESGNYDDYIVKIVATRTTAAFITSKGLIYTWGKDTKAATGGENRENILTTEYTNESAEYKHYLLLRPTSSSGSYDGDVKWYEPYVINYAYLGNRGLTKFIPGDSALTRLDIAAGEYNYIVSRYESSTSSYRTFVWGSMLYSALQVGTPSTQIGMSYAGYDYRELDGGNVGSTLGGSDFYAWDTRGNASSDTRFSPVAGGYTVGVNFDNGTSGATSLYLRGKNFINTVNEAQAEADRDLITTTELTDAGGSTSILFGSDLAYSIDGAIAGGQGSSGNLNSNIVGGGLGTYYGRQKASSSLTYSVTETRTVYNSHGTELVTAGSEEDRVLYNNAPARTTYNVAVSLGNDIGYGIVNTSGASSKGSLYGWGDNTQKQITQGSEISYTSPNLILEETGVTYLSVAAGKQISNEKRAFYQSDSVTVAGSGTDAYVTGFNSDVVNLKDYITGVVGSDGALRVWSTYDSKVKTYNNRIKPVKLYYNGDVVEWSSSENKYPNPAHTINEMDKFIAVYSGYGNNLFAVTALGKMVRITAVTTGDDDSKTFVRYNMERYDSFNVNKWEVDSTNEIVFNALLSSTANTAPALGSVTIYPWSAVLESPATAGEVTINTATAVSGVFPIGTTTGYRPLVKLNNIGDSFRIYTHRDRSRSTSTRLWTAADPENAKSEYVGDTAYSAYEPAFYYCVGNEETLMTKTQQENMFEFKVVYDATNNVGLRISPKQSSKGATIKVKFYIARYNLDAAFAGSSDGTPADRELGTVSSDTALYYDWLPCEIKLEIKDTRSVLTYHEFETADESGVWKVGNSTIPLLDPNNDNNKSYSIAVQNVSDGVDALIEYLLGAGSAQANALKGLITADMAKKDSGYPSSDKIAAGNLTYYLGSDVGTKYYTDKYQYMFTDRDADIIGITPLSGNVLLIQKGTGAVTPTATGPVIASIPTKDSTEGIRIEVDLSGSEHADILNAILAQDTYSKIKTDFDNKYGLINLTFDSDTKKLSFVYKIINFLATSRTGPLTYGDEGTVSSFQTTDSKPRLEASVLAKTYYKFDKDYNLIDTDKNVIGYDSIGDTVTSGFASIFAMPTVRLKKELYTGAVPGGQVYGKNNASVVARENVYNYTYPSTIPVGGSGEISLKGEFVTELGDGDIRFSYHDAVDKESLDAFDATFFDETCSADVSVVKMQQNKITITPTVKKDIVFTVCIQRFYATGSKSYNPFKTSTPDVYDEKIYVKVTIPKEKIDDFTFTQSTTALKELPLITKTESVTLFGGGNAINPGPFVTLKAGTPTAETFLTGKIYIPSGDDFKYSEQVKPANERLFTVTITDKQSFTITPLASGVGTVQFFAKVYGKSLSFTVTVKVSYMTKIPDTVTISDDKYIDVATIKSKLVADNASFNSNISKYDILYDDVANATAKDSEKIYNALFFKDKNGDVTKPPFVKNVIFEGVKSGKPNIRVISEKAAVNDSDPYYLYIKFTDITDDETCKTYDDIQTKYPGHIVEAYLTIHSGKVSVPNFSVAVDCHKPAKNPDWGSISGSGAETTVKVSISHLLDLAGIQGSTLYEGFLVTADSSVAKYMNYDLDGDNMSIVITPLLNTTKKDKNGKPVPFNCVLNVSVAHTTEPEIYPNQVVSFEVGIDGIYSTLPLWDNDEKIGYLNILLYSFIIVFGVLAVIFVIRLILYWKKRAKQRAIIKRNQELIRMRDRMHNKATAASRDQVVRTKLKMEDPKYAKMFNEMRKSKEEESGVILENSDLAATASKKSAKKKKGGKKTVAELKAELEAKKAAFAGARAKTEQGVNPFGDPGAMGGMGPMGGMDPGAMGGMGPNAMGGMGPMGGMDGSFDSGFDGGAQSIDGSEIIFDAGDIGDGM